MKGQEFDITYRLDLKEQGVAELLFEFDDPPTRISYTQACIRALFINEKEDQVIIAHSHDGALMYARHVYSQMIRVPDKTHISPVIQEALEILGYTPDLS